MELTKDQEEVIQKIIDLKGHCLESTLCKRCPFKKDCLPEFIKSRDKRPTQKERLAMALNTISRNIIIKEEDADEM